MKKGTSHLVDESGFDILVSYSYSKAPSQVEEGHGHHEVGGGYDIELNSVEIVFGGKGIELLPMMTERQKNHVIDQIEID